MTKHTSNYYSLVTFAMHTQAFCHPLLLSRRPVDSNDNGRRQRERQKSGAPNENIVQKHLNIALLNVF